MTWWRMVMWPAPNPKPFAGVRWARWLLVLACLAVPFLSVCPDDTGINPFSLKLLLGASLLIALLGCMWEAHIRTWLAGPLSYRRWFTRTLRNAMSILGGVLLLSLPLGFLLPSYACYANRAKVGEALNVVTSVKQHVTEKVLQTKTLNNAGVGLTLDANRFVTLGHISSDATIMLFVQDAKAALVIEPSIVDLHTGELTWKCRGVPHRAMPSQCRQP